MELGAQEFIARIITHIPDVQERQVVYYGTYANASALQREHRRAREGQGEASPWAPPAEEPTPFERRCRMLWAQLIFYSWRPGESLVTLSRSPPELLAVAESA